MLIANLIHWAIACMYLMSSVFFGHESDSVMSLFDFHEGGLVFSATRRYYAGVQMTLSAVELNVERRRFAHLKSLLA